ncbi:peptide ABC transporter substrate-binding protein [Marinicella litoralis]|nr:peptide ABC transporter substrate-binding protein [Marinicella litoralis]
MNYTLRSLLYFFLISTAVCHAQTFHRGNGSEPDSLNIHQAQGINSQNILLDLYEGLMTFDAKGLIIPGAITHYQVSEDQLQWHFYLNPHAKWSDGTSLTANDFLFAWQTAIDPQVAAPYRQLFNNLMRDGELNVTAPHSLQLHITLNYPDASFLNKLVLPIFFPLPSHNNDRRVSNGAFYLSQWDIQEKIHLLKNKHYHQADKVQLKEVVYWVTENQNSELLRFRANELDLTETIPDHQIDWLKKNHPNELKIAPYYGTFFLGLNLNDSLLNNPKLRQALSASIDRDILVNKVLKSGQQAAYAIIPPVEPTPKDPLINIPKAKQLLADSGFNKETDHLEILYNNSDNQKKVALAVAAMWRQNLGIKSRLRNQEWKIFVNTRKSPNKQVFRSGWIADYFSPINFLELFHSNSHFNFYGMKQQKYDDLIDAMNTTTDPSLLNKLTIQAEQILSDELPVIPLYHYVSRHLVAKHIKGYHDNLMDKHLSRYISK